MEVASWFGIGDGKACIWNGLDPNLDTEQLTCWHLVFSVEFEGGNFTRIGMDTGDGHGPDGFMAMDHPHISPMTPGRDIFPGAKPLLPAWVDTYCSTYLCRANEIKASHPPLTESRDAHSSNHHVNSLPI